MIDTANTSESEKDVYIDAGQSGGMGTVLVDNATISMTSQVNAGIGLGTHGNGTAEMTVTNGSTVSLFSTGTEGFATLDLGRSDGDGNEGTLLVDNGSSIDLNSTYATRFNIGDDGSTGAATVSGIGSRITMTSGLGEFGFLRVGRGSGSIGELTVENAAAIALDGPQTRLEIGTDGDAIGRVSVIGGGTIDVLGPDGVVRVGDNDPVAGDNALGLLTVEGTGSRVAASSRIEVGQFEGAGTATGILSVNAGAEVSAPVLRLGEGGILKGSGGTVTGNVVVNGGFIIPGASPGALTIDGDLFATDGVLQLEIAGTGAGMFDQLFVTGDVSFSDDFSIVVSLLDSFMPAEGTLFDVLRSGARSISRPGCRP